MSDFVDIDDILHEIATAMDGIADEVFVQKVPKAIPERLDSYLLIVMRNEVNNQFAYKRTYAQIYAVAKDKANGVMNVPLINEMTETIFSKFPYHGEGFTLTSPTITPYRSIEGFSYAIINSQLTI